MSNLIEQLKRHEGFSAKPYKCTAGKTTIGYGRNLDDVGISNVEAELMLTNDVISVIARLTSLPVYNALDDVRRGAIVNMTFNIGFSGVMKFAKMWNCLALKDYHGAAAEMLNSKWAKQVGERAQELAEQMRAGKFKE